jgi:hypothetical protein
MEEWPTSSETTIIHLQNRLIPDRCLSAEVLPQELDVLSIK